MKIALIPVGEIKKEILSHLADKLAKTFSARIEITEPLQFPDYAYYPPRGQYYTVPIVEWGKKQRKGKADWHLLICDVDLFVPQLNFVFGEAEPGTGWAITSLTRLKEEFYGRAEKKELLIKRTEKEAVHELGHLRGLAHCSDVHCVMHFSNSLADTDIKSADFCENCRKILKKGGVK